MLSQATIIWSLKIMFNHIYMPIYIIRLPDGVAPVSDMFLRKIDEVFKEFKELANVFSIDDDILSVIYNDDGTDHDQILQNVLHIGKKENFKPNKQKCHFRCKSIPFFGETVYRYVIKTNPTSCMGKQRFHLFRQKYLQSFLGTFHYFRKLSPAKAEVCEPLH